MEISYRKNFEFVPNGASRFARISYDRFILSADPRRLSAQIPQTEVPNLFHFPFRFYFLPYFYELPEARINTE